MSKCWWKEHKKSETKNLVPRIQTAKLHGHTDNLQTGVKNLHKLDQNKIYKTGQKNRHEKSTRCTWEPGIVCQ